MYTKKNLIFNLIQNVFVGLAITVAVTLLSGGFTTAGDFILGFLKAYLINYVACLIFPIPVISAKLFKVFKIKPGSFWGVLINVIQATVFYVTFVTFFAFLWNLGFNTFAIKVWWSMYWILLIVGFAAGLAFANISMWITCKIIREKPKPEGKSEQTDTPDSQEEEPK